MKKAVLILALALAACGDNGAFETAWGQRCLRAGFNGDQCGLMLDQLKASRNAQSAANSAAAFSLFALGNNAVSRK